MKKKTRESVFTFARNRCSRSLGIGVHVQLGIGVHVQSESVFTFSRNRCSRSARNRCSRSARNRCSRSVEIGVHVRSESVHHGSLGICIAGQPPYNPWALLKLYLYGYQHGIRSSRKLEAETRRNLEVIWLVEGLQPSYKSIADFRKDHMRQLREVTRDFVLLCRELSLFGGVVVAVDGSFFKADASKKSIQTKAYIDKALEKIEEKIEEYHQILDRQDAADEKAGARDTSNDEVLSEKIEKMKRKQAEKRDIKARIERSGDSQASMTDKDARLLKKSAQAVAGYNAQIVVDSKHKLVVAQDVSQNGDDRAHLASMLVEAKRRLDVEELTGLADRGYYDGAQFKECEDENITVYVPSPDKSLAMKKKGRYSKKDFTYDARGDCYYCPQGKQLKRCKATVTKNSRTYVQYISKSIDCKACAVREHCLGAQRRTKDTATLGA